MPKERGNCLAQRKLVCHKQIFAVESTKPFGWSYSVSVRLKKKNPSELK